MGFYFNPDTFSLELYVFLILSCKCKNLHFHEYNIPCSRKHTKPIVLPAESFGAMLGQMWVSSWPPGSRKGNWKQKVLLTKHSR